MSKIGHGAADFENFLPPDHYVFTGGVKKNQSCIGTCRQELRQDNVEQLMGNQNELGRLS
jgi:hypothetical protein